MHPRIPRLRIERLTWRALLLTLVVGEVAVALGLLVYLQLSNETLLISFVERAPEEAGGASTGLIVPVAGVRRDDLVDTYGAARAAGRSHKGIDIIAAPGTPVLAAATGVVVARETTGPGGLSVYQRGEDSRTIYYYAHLQRHAPGLKPGDLVRQGDVIGYVGDSGNARGTPHLHFASYTVTDPNRWWRGRDMNPFSLLRGPEGPDSSPP